MRAEDAVLLVLILATLALLCASCVFGAATVFLRLRHLRTQRRRRRLEAQWGPSILAVLARDLPSQQLRAQVAQADRLFFVDFVMRHAERLKGTERALACELAAPYLDGIAERCRARSAER